MGTVAGLQGGSFAVGQMVGPLVSGDVADFLGLGAVFPVRGGIGLLGTGLVMVWLCRWKNARYLLTTDLIPEVVAGLQKLLNHL